MLDQLFTYYIENPLVIISINRELGVQIMVIRLDIEIWVFGKGGSTRGGRKRVGWVGKKLWELLDFVALVHVWVYSVVVEGVCARNCRGLGLCTVGTVS
jgi:hypothetical protein